MSLIPDEERHPDIIDLLLDGEIPIKKIGQILAHLDREVTGYPYEEYDEYGDNPEECFSEPTIDGYSFEYSPDLRFPSLRIFLKRDKPEELKEQWHRWFSFLRSFDLKIHIVNAHCVCSEGREYRFEWDNIVKGKCPHISWGFDGLREIFGIDLGNYHDWKLTVEWINYIFKNYRKPTETDYYHFTGSLGHS